VRRVYHSAIPASSVSLVDLAAGDKVVGMEEALRVVVAEDEGLIRMDVVATLQEAGYKVVGEAADGEEAIKLATELEPDLVVMDIKMPKLDGISAAEKIAELKIPVVLLTAFSQADLVARAAEAGAMAYVTKPFKPSDLSCQRFRLHSPDTKSSRRWRLRLQTSATGSRPES
jgi:AmiR/NasT family two-component response regulator